MNAAHLTTTADHLTTLHTYLANVRRWPASKRRAALIEEYEAQIEELEAALELGAEVAEAREEMATEQVETSAVLDRAMTAAHTTGCALVKGAARVGAELARLVPDCMVQRGAVKIWTVRDESGEYRLVVRDGSFNGVMSWRR